MDYNREYRRERGLLSTEQLRQLQHSPTNVVDPLTIDTTNEKEYLKRAINKLIREIEEVNAVKMERGIKEKNLIEETSSPSDLESEVFLRRYESTRHPRRANNTAESYRVIDEASSSTDDSGVKRTSNSSRYSSVAADHTRSQSPLMSRLYAELECMKDENDRLRHELWQLRTVERGNKKLRDLESEVQMLRIENEKQKKAALRREEQHREGNIRRGRPKQYRTDQETRAVIQSEESLDEKMNVIMREMQRMNDRFEQKDKESVHDRLRAVEVQVGNRSPSGGSSNKSRRSPTWRRGNGNTSTFNNSQSGIRSYRSTNTNVVDDPTVDAVDFDINDN